MGEFLLMAHWKHSRDYYANLVRIYRRIALLSVVFFLISIIIFTIDKFKLIFLLPALIFAILYIIMQKLKARALYNYYRAPAKL